MQRRGEGRFPSEGDSKPSAGGTSSRQNLDVTRRQATEWQPYPSRDYSYQTSHPSTPYGDATYQSPYPSTDYSYQPHHPSTMYKAGESLLTRGLKAESSRTQQPRESEYSSYDVLRGRSYNDFLRQGPTMGPAEAWGSSEVNIERDSPGAYSGDSASTSLQKVRGEQFDNRRGDNRDLSRKELLRQPFNDFYNLRNYALQMAGDDGLEPQVRDAVLDLNKKGYKTQSSGFSSDMRMQQIDGPFVLDKPTKEKLKSMGVEVSHNSKEYEFMRDGQGGNYKDYTVIRFATGQNNLRDIQKEWARVAQQIPNVKR